MQLTICFYHTVVTVLHCHSWKMQKGIKDIVFFPVFNPGEIMKAPHRSNFFGLFTPSPPPQVEGLLPIEVKEIQSLKFCYPVPFT